MVDSKLIKEYNMNWTYDDKKVLSHKDIPSTAKAMVYIIHYEDGYKYVGSKTLRSLRRLKPTKKQLAIRKNYVRKELVDLPFAKYEGSSVNTKDLKIVKKEILLYTRHSKQARYWELYYQFKYQILSNEKFINENINGSYFLGDDAFIMR